MTGLTAQGRIDRAKARSWVLQVLYRWESDPTDTMEGALATTLQTRRVSERRTDAIEGLVRLVDAHLVEVDRTLEGALDNWTLDRLSKIDRSILRIGATELLFRGDVPPKVAIQEAVRLAESYGGDESPRFVNGVLDAVFRTRG